MVDDSKVKSSKMISKKTRPVTAMPKVAEKIAQRPKGDNFLAYGYYVSPKIIEKKLKRKIFKCV
jgi:hypothetical protein